MTHCEIPTALARDVATRLPRGAAALTDFGDGWTMLTFPASLDAAVTDAARAALGAWRRRREALAESLGVPVALLPPDDD